MSSALEAEGLADRLAHVQRSVTDAAREAGRNPADITTIVVTKFQPPSLVRDLTELGVSDVAENRAQEAAAKASELESLRLRWHFIGQLQTNKARLVREFATAIHSVDRPSLVDALASDDGDVDCFLQLALSDDPGRGGVGPDRMLALAEHVLRTPGLRLRGVMAVAPLTEHPRSAFARVRRESERLRALAPDASAISAGMSGDYADAIAEGATHLRIGTAITGKRPERA